jgi:hypothetical protein
MSNASAESAAGADRKMPNVPRNPRQKCTKRTTGNGCLETSVPGKCANTQLAPVLVHIIERIDAIDVDEARGAGEPKIHRRYEALSAGEDLSFLAVRSEEIKRMVNRAGGKILERDGFHQLRAGPSNSCHSR